MTSGSTPAPHRLHICHPVPHTSAAGRISAGRRKNWQSRYDDASGGRTVGVYETVDLGMAYTGIKNLNLSAKVKSLLDKSPPSSNQNSYFPVGFDPANSDPRGRTIVLGASYKFF